MGRGSSKAGGFPKSLVQTIVYHGTNAPNIKTFSAGGKESNGAIFFSESEDYAEEEANVKYQSRGGSKTMYEVNIDIRNPLEVTLKGEQFADNFVEGKYIRQAKQQGYDSVIFHSDYGEGNEWMNDTFYAVFSPKQVKIKNKRKI